MKIREGRIQKKLVSIAVMLLTGFTSGFANNPIDVSSKFKEALKREYPGAVIIKWVKIEDYQMARFDFHGHQVVAYFREDSELAGSVRDILFEELPTDVIRLFDKRFAGADFIQIVEISNSEGTHYKLTVDMGNERYRIKVSANADIVDIVKIKNN